MRSVAILPALLAAAPAGAVEWPDCYCTGSYGESVELGQSACLVVDGRSFLARCEMALNNPTWRETDEACLSSRLQRGPGGLGPSLKTLAVDAEVVDAPEPQS